MPFSGSAGAKTFSRNTGVYTGTTAWAQTEAAARGIVSTDADTHDQDLATAINTSYQKNGDNAMTAAVRMGGFGLSNAGALFSNAATLSDTATPALDASLGNTFVLTATGDRTIAVPTNATAGQRIIIVHIASGGARTLALNTGAGGFAYGSDITALTQTVSGKTDYIGCVYSSASSKWHVIGYVKGYT